jgi:cupin fold WbuC family metalloprotein
MTTPVQCITRSDLDALAAAAQRGARRRQNRNLHPALTDPVQRLLNALELGSYVPPHRHAIPAKWELMALLTGRAVLLTFNDAGVVQERIDLDAGTPVIEVPPATWHTLAALLPHTVLLEVKPGPYVPVASVDVAPWAPEEGSPDAVALESWFRTAAPGDRAPRGTTDRL